MKQDEHNHYYRITLHTVGNKFEAIKEELQRHFYNHDCEYCNLEEISIEEAIQLIIDEMKYLESEDEDEDETD